MRRLPSLLRRLLLDLVRRAVPGDWGHDVARDLEEAHGRRRGPAADLWLAGQAALLVARFGVERVREGSGRGAMEGALRDLRYALRTLARAPLFAGVVALTLAVGVGASSAIFSVVQAVLFQPLSYPHADRLAVLAPYPWSPSVIPREAARSTAAVEELAGYYPERFALAGGERPEEVEGARVTPNYLPLLGADLRAGRGFLPEDTMAGAAATVVVAQALWARQFGAGPFTAGATLRVDGEPRQVVGVVEPGFRALGPGLDEPELWVPFAMAAREAEGSPGWGIPLVRVAPGSSPALASTDLAAAVQRYRTEGDPEEDWMPSPATRWIPLAEDLTGPVRPALLMLMGAVGLVLLLAWVNVASLLVARMAARQTEVAVRRALGASRGALLRQLLAESLVLSTLGGLLGLGLAGACLELVVAAAPSGVPCLDDVAVDVPAFLFALGVSVSAAVVLALAAIWSAGGSSMERALKEGSRTAAGSQRRHRLARGLVVAELTMTLVLVATAGLLARSFVLLSSQPTGFRTEDVLALPLHVREGRVENVLELEDHYRRLADELRRVPGLESLGLANNLPLSRANASRSIVVEGEAEPRVAEYGVVNGGYFDVLDIPLVRGRSIREEDVRASLPAAVVDRAMADLVWPDENPVGQRFRFVGSEEWLTVVGVSGNVRGDGLSVDPGPGFYVSWQQRPVTDTELAVGRDMVFLLRLRPGAGDLPAALRTAIWRVDPDQPVPSLVRLSDVVREGVAPERFRALLLGAFAAAAVILAVAGIYGVIGHMMAERTQELGIRRALGATALDVTLLVLAWGARRALLGVAIGVVAVLAVRQLLEGLLFGLAPSDPVTLAGSALTVLFLAVAACLPAAVQAARADGVGAVRGD